jgi:hypothetical protein
MSINGDRSAFARQASQVNVSNQGVARQGLVNRMQIDPTREHCQSKGSIASPAAELQRAPLPNRMTSTVCRRMSMSKTRLWFFT